MHYAVPVVSVTSAMHCLFCWTLYIQQNVTTTYLWLHWNWSAHVHAHATHTFLVRRPFLSKMFAQCSCSGNRLSVYSTSSFCSQMWLWMCTPVWSTSSPSPFSSCGEQVGANRGVTAGCTSGFCGCMCVWEVGREGGREGSYVIFTLNSYHIPRHRGWQISCLLVKLP